MPKRRRRKRATDEVSDHGASGVIVVLHSMVGDVGPGALVVVEDLAGHIDATDTRVALGHLDAGLHDNHGKVTHPGSELLAVNGTPAQEAYAQATLQTSASAEGLRDYLTPARMTMGNPGEPWKLRIRHLDGRVNDYLLPLVDDKLYGHANRHDGSWTWICSGPCSSSDARGNSRGSDRHELGQSGDTVVNTVVSGKL